MLASPIYIGGETKSMRGVPEAEQEWNPRAPKVLDNFPN